MTAATRTAEAPAGREESATDDATGSPYRVILYNDDVHGFDDVVRQVQKATGVATEEAFAITLHAHETGRAVCYAGSLDSCEKVAEILREIALHVEIDQAG
ncbi:MAG: ATP-dependent Clp protease adaptor ClpS [Nitrospirota bacterium]